MESSDPQIISQALVNVPFDKKWEILRPTIAHLYVEEGWKLSEVVACLKERHNFNAAESQYKYQIRKWKLKRSLPAKKKNDLYRALQSRAQAGKSFNVTYKGRPYDAKNFRRHNKIEMRQVRNEMILRPEAGGRSLENNAFIGHQPLFGNRIFMNWNVPYGPNRTTAVSVSNHPSPMSDILVATPPSADNAPSPTSAVIRTRMMIDRARLFVEGRQAEMLGTMNRQERTMISTWMYQFWFYSFKTAKHWGRGPRNWTVDILGFGNHPEQDIIPISSPNTPISNIETSNAGLSPMEGVLSHVPESSAKTSPSVLCNWSIHADCADYSERSSSPPSGMDQMDLEDEESWPSWPPAEVSGAITERLSNGLESNSFSNIKQSELPIAVDLITKATKRSPEELAKEAIGFAIMSRNEGLLFDLVRTHKGTGYSGLYPGHLAASYLDGAKACCNIFDGVRVMDEYPFRKQYVNHLGHTILDQLMMGILKGHTSCLPVVVDIAFKGKRRFDGEDVDICGRWDADSDCVRSLLADGISSIPFEWKHMFCHTSIQTMVHFIGTLFGSPVAPDINIPSGLFVKYCSCCGLKLQNMPLHTLIMIGVHLAQSGCEGENLFGILACLVCLLNYGAKPLKKAIVSMKVLMGDEGFGECDHTELDPLELMGNVPPNLTSAWSERLRTGWQVISKILNDAQVEWRLLEDGNYCSRTRDPMSSGEDEDEGGSDSDCISNPMSFEEDEDEGKSDSDYISNPMSFEDEDEGGSDSDFISEDELGSTHQPPHWEHPCLQYCDGEYRHRDLEDFHVKYFGRSKILAPLWAAIQTELLTHRRVGAGDPWISPNFDMSDLNDSLGGEGDMAIALLQKAMMKPFCGCGRFLGGVMPACALIADATDPNHLNYGIWNRTTYIDSPRYRYDAW